MDKTENTFEVVVGSQIVTAYKDIGGKQLKPGDLYVARRNVGWKLAICDSVCMEYGYVNAMNAMVYAYDCYECFKVKEIRPMDVAYKLDERSIEAIQTENNASALARTMTQYQIEDLMKLGFPPGHWMRTKYRKSDPMMVCQKALKMREYLKTPAHKVVYN